MVEDLGPEVVLSPLDDGGDPALVVGGQRDLEHEGNQSDLMIQIWWNNQMSGI